jgi:hypothetical protein
MKRIIVFTVFVAACGNVFSQVSVVPPTGITPRFLKSDKELVKQTKPPSGNWLRDANDDTERFRRIESWAGAIDGEMQIISHRLEELHAAIQKGNWDLGVYHWEKIRFRMNVASMKRPARTQNLEGMFLESGVWQSMNNALVAKDAEQSRAEFQKVLQTCMACHIAEKVGFLNESPVFKRLATFPPLAK